jgi:hypothetical protein
MKKGSSTGRFGVTIDVSPLDKLAKELKGFENEIPGAVSSALNRTVQHVYTKIGSIVTENYAVKSQDVKSTMRSNITKASKGKLSASIRSIGHTLSFAHFPHNPQSNIIARTMGVQHSKARVRVKILKGKGYVTSKVGFIAKTGAKSADKVQFNVFKRLGKSRLPIAPIRTLSIPQMITNKTTEEKITDLANKKLAERIDHEIKYRLDKVQKEMKT